MTQDQLKEWIEKIGVRRITERNGYFHACCPLHPDNNPSWAIYFEEPHFYGCLGCGARGTLFDLLIRVGNVPYSEAKKICLIYRSANVLPSLVEHKKKIREIDETELYPYELEQIARIYLHKRGISPEIAEKLGCVYTPSDRRILIPWMYEEKLVGVTGVSIKKDEDYAKVLPYFGTDKRNFLYLPSGKILKGLFILVEGEIDCLKVFQTYPNVGAIGHGSFTRLQKELLLHSACDEVMAFGDDDETGDRIQKETYEFFQGKKKLSSVDYSIFQNSLRLKNKLDPAFLSNKGVARAIRQRELFSNWPTF